MSYKRPERILLTIVKKKKEVLVVVHIPTGSGTALESTSWSIPTVSRLVIS